VVRAYQTLDCASKVRVHYLLPAAVTRDFLELFPDAQVSVQEFSRLVRGAKDHFIILRSERLRAAGVLGESRLVVTYGKPQEERPEEEISAFEARLTRAGFGPVEYHHRPPTWPAEPG
jgi:hypothetical protein